MTLSSRERKTQVQNQRVKWMKLVHWVKKELPDDLLFLTDFLSTNQNEFQRKLQKGYQRAQQAAGGEQRREWETFAVAISVAQQNIFPKNWRFLCPSFCRCLCFTIYQNYLLKSRKIISEAIIVLNMAKAEILTTDYLKK